MVSVAAPSHRDLPVWQRADDLAQLVYRLTWKFMQADPGLAQRMRAAAISVAAGIAASQRSARWQARRTLLAVSLALAELEYCMYFARRAGFIGDADLHRLTSLEGEVSHHLAPLMSANVETRGPALP